MRPLVARIDSAALAHNLGVARAAAPQARVMAAIKANAYGHGLLRAAQGLRATDAFAVLSLDEATQLRSQGYTHPIVLLEGFFAVEELAEIVRLRLRPVIHRTDQIDLLERLRAEQRLDVLLKVDTGMHRLGLHPKRVPESLARLQALPQIGGITLMTHFACADDPAVGVAQQLAVFNAMLPSPALPRTPPPLAGEGLMHMAQASRESCSPPPQAGEGPGEREAVQTSHPGGRGRLTCSLANSAALLRYPETHADWVRPGIMLYGASPFAGQTGADLGLLPVMHLESRLIAVQTVRKGEGLGYGWTYVAERDMKVGIVACGYADGYPRHAPSGTPVRVGGVLTRTLGRVSMDMLCVDLGPVPAAHVGTLVTLWGDGLPVEHVAAAAGTIAYELLSAVAPRVRVEAT